MISENTTNQRKNDKPASKTALRRQRERELRYSTILKAAETLFAKEGYHQTSMEQIADLAEVSVGTLYFYFKNKEDLLIQLIDESGYQLRELLGREFKKANFTLAGIARAGQVFFEEFCPRHAEKMTILYRESIGQGPQVEEHRRRVINKLVGDVKNALVRLGEKMNARFKSDYSVEVMAVSITGMFERISYEYLISQDRSWELKPIGEDAIQFILGGIQNLLK